MKTPVFLSLLSLFVSALCLASSFAEARSDFRLASASKRAVERDIHAERNLPNAERLRRGMLPTIPKRLYDPSRVQAREPNPSNVPPTELTGRIKVIRDSDNTHIGYVSSGYQNPPPSSYAWYGLSSTSPLIVKFTPPASGPMNIGIVSSSNFPFLGLTGSTMPSPTDPDPYQQNLGRITQSNAVPAGSPPTDVQHGRWPYSLYAETAVWYYNQATNALTATWISENLAAYPVHFYNFFDVGAHVNGFAFTTNTLTYNDLLDLYLVPTDKQAKIRFEFEQV